MLQNFYHLNILELKIALKGFFVFIIASIKTQIIIDAIDVFAHPPSVIMVEWSKYFLVCLTAGNIIFNISKNRKKDDFKK